jgi:hypothetical protein
VERWRIGCEGGGGESSGAGRSGLEMGQGGVGEERWEEGVLGCPFYRVGGGAGRLGIEGERVAVVVCHNGGGGSHFRRGSASVVVGSDEEGGGCSDRYGRGRGVGRWRANAH